MESEGSWKQNSALSNTNHIKYNRWDESPTQVEVQRLHRQREVNIAEYEVKVNYRTVGGLTDVWKQRREYMTEGYNYVVNMDLEKFFDTVNHSKLIELLSPTVKDNRVISLIHRYLGRVQIGQTFEWSTEGVP